MVVRRDSVQEVYTISYIEVIDLKQENTYLGIVAHFSHYGENK